MHDVRKAWLLLGLTAAACAPSTAQEARETPPDPTLFTAKPGPTLKRFASNAAFAQYVSALARPPQAYALAEPAPPPPVMAAAPMTEAASADMADGAANPEITNNQTVGVDEGGIVKQVGRFLVVLQDARVFSIDLGTAPGAPLRLAGRINVYRAREKAASWYDEMLVFGDRILITAYNYAERASEITVLRLDSQGGLRREGRYLLSSEDYYSTENYATRLVGDSLVFYAPFALEGYGRRFEWPRLRRADGDGEADRGKPLLRATQVYAPPGKVEYPVLHTVSICPLTAGMECRTTAFVGPAMREFYVSPRDAFLWIGADDGLPWAIDYANRRRQRKCGDGEYWATSQSQAALLYRLPLDGSSIGAIGVDGTPADQFALDSKDGRFRALLSRPRGCTAWGKGGPLALLDVPLAAFGPQLRQVGERGYAPLPAIEGGALENRFVGDWLVYGGREGWSSMASKQQAPRGSALFAVPLRDPRGVRRLALPHNAIRIERAGGDAVVTGYRDNRGLSLSYVRLGRAPQVASTVVLPTRFESEGRSHAFNAWVRRDGSGVMGIPTSVREWRSGRGWSDSASSELSFVAFGPDKQLASAGELGLSGRKTAPGYACEVSCVDWYGNSRPIFTGGRIFALMGTELVEGELRDGRIAGRGRVDLTGPVR